MAATLATVEDIVNAALSRIGHAVRIADIYEGSPASLAALDIYGQTRDELLRKQDWGFSERNVAMTALKIAPAGGYGPWAPWNQATNPPPPWLFEYPYPDDCLKVRAIKGIPGFGPNFQPYPNSFSIINDGAIKAIVTNADSAILVYTGQVTDPNLWEPGFTEALISSLSRRLAPALAKIDQGKAEDEKIEGADEQTETIVAEMLQG